MSWVDSTGVRDVTLVQTAGAPPERAVEQLYWNRSIAHERLLGDAVPTDVYAAPALRVGRDGSLRGVNGPVLFQDYAATARFQNAATIASAGTFTLSSADGTPKLGLLEEGRFFDGWLAREGRLRLWPDGIGPHAGHAPLRVDAPAGLGADLGQLRQRALRRRAGPRSPRSSTRSTSAAPGRSASRRRAAAGSPTSAWSASARARRPSSAPSAPAAAATTPLRRSRRRRSRPSRPSGPARSDAPSTGSCARSPVPAAARPRPSDPPSYGRR